MGVRKRLRVAAAVVAVLLFAPTPTSGQTVSERRVREAIEDAARGLGQALSGGSAVTGPAATTGGLARFRLSAVGGVTEIGVIDPTRSQGELDFTAPSASLAAAVGIWDGPGVGSIDVLARAGIVAVGDEFDDGTATLMLGARVGLVRETLATPAVSASVYRSWIPDMSFNELGGDEVAFDADLDAWSGRLDVSKTFVIATPYAGVGLDRTTIDASYRIPASRSTGDRDITGTIGTSSSHGKIYGGIELGAAIVGLTVEAGRYDGGWFGFVGLRLGGS